MRAARFFGIGVGVYSPPPLSSLPPRLPNFKIFGWGGWRPYLRPDLHLISSLVLRSISLRPDLFFSVPDLRACSWYSLVALCSWIEVASTLSQFRIVSVSLAIDSRTSSGSGRGCSVAGKLLSMTANLAVETFGRPNSQISFAIIVLPQRLRSTASALLLFLFQGCALCISSASLRMKLSMY